MILIELLPELVEFVFSFSEILLYKILDLLFRSFTDIEENFE